MGGEAPIFPLYLLIISSADMDTTSETQPDLKQNWLQHLHSFHCLSKATGGPLTEPTRTHIRLHYFINKVDTHKDTGKRSKIFNLQDAINHPGPDNWPMPHGCLGRSSTPTHACLRPCKNSSCLCFVCCKKTLGSMNLLQACAHTNRFLGSAMLHLFDTTSELAWQRRAIICYKN